MTNGEKLEQVFPNGIIPFSNNWLKAEYKVPTPKESLVVEDCVSRADLKKWLDMNFSFGGALRKLEMFDRIDKELPPVTPTRKVGKWINKSKKSACGIEFVASECTCCGKKTPFNCDELIYNFCPNCGAEMESEDGSN